MPLPSQLVQRTKQLQLRTGQAAARTAQQGLPDLSKLSRQETGGVLRTVATATLDRFGNVATQAARISYDDMRASVPAKKYTATSIEIAPAELADPIVGRAMALATQERWADAATGFLASLDRVIGDIFRETIVDNSYDDSEAIGYQRVASPDSCAFCSLVALNEYTSFPDSGGYHDHCGCTTIPVFRGLGSFKPSYYDDIEEEYFAARVDGAKTADAILANWRLQTGRK